MMEMQTFNTHREEMQPFNTNREREPDLQTGFTLFFQQLKALLVKNFTLLWRNKISTSAQVLVSPLFFIGLIFLITQWSITPGGAAVKHPGSKTSLSIPQCETKLYSASPCYDFIWSGNESSRVTLIVRKIMENNPGRPIPPHKVKSFKTKEEVDEWLYANSMRCPGALHFAERSNEVISYGLQTNSTPSRRRGQFEDIMMKFQMPLQIAAEREIARSLVRESNFIWMFGLKEFPHPAKYEAREDSFFFMTTAAHLLLAISLLHFIDYNSSLVAEKQLKLRQAMTIMNISDTAYWLSWLISTVALDILLSLITIGFGIMFRLPWFINTSFVIIFLVFFLFQLSMIGFSFMLSTILRKASSSIIMGLVVFMASYISQFISLTVLGFPYYPSGAYAYQILWSLFPPNLFAKSFQILHVAAGQGGISWSKRSQCFDLVSFGVDQPQCALTMTHVFKLHIELFFLWFLVAVYLDNVIPNSSGVRKPIFYFLYRGYWTGKGGKLEEGGILSCLRSNPTPEYKEPDDEAVEEDEAVKEDEDVKAEKNSVKYEQTEVLVDANAAVQFRGLVKTYPKKLEIGCCKLHRKSHVHAVKGLWFNVPKDQLFCLLGPKGAGKTSIINCLTGISPATNGDVLIYGDSIRSADMSNIRRFIGFCPQFDILWDSLSGEEHLNLFANIKGIPPPLIRLAVQKALEDVKLTDAAKRRAGSYSGVMKCRLRMAIALVGDPKLVIFDKPTTDMDPINKRHVWDIVRNVKNGRTIILTTHSVEEADALGDRIGIVAKGRLRCIGTSTRLKSKYGSDLLASFNFSQTTDGVPDSCRDDLNDFVKQHLNVLPKEEIEDSVNFVISPTEESLTDFVEELELEERREDFAIAGIQLGSTTLEEVYLKVIKKAALENVAPLISSGIPEESSRQAEDKPEESSRQTEDNMPSITLKAVLENLEAEDNMPSITLKSGSRLMIPVGADNIGIPESASAENLRGLMVKVYWGQDTDGNLYITGFSPETPIPEDLDDFPPMLPNGDPPRGYVLDFYL